MRYTRNNMNDRDSSRGYMVMLVLVFGAVFVTILFGLTGFVLVQQKATEEKEDGYMAFHIAEAGLEYYRWFLAHHPDDTTDGTGEEGPYEHIYTDPEGGEMGMFSLDIQGNTSCGEITSIDIYSTGWVSDNTDLIKTVYGRYTRPSVAEYAYILNDNVWAGSDRQIYGPYHSNLGIRMDGTNHSVVTSGVETWTCTESFGCDTSQTVDGIFGDGSGSDLWVFPEETVDFNGMVLDIAHMKDRAQHGGGLYFPKVSNWRNREGYHIIFRENGTLDVYEVTSTARVYSDPVGKATGDNYEDIVSRSYVGNYALPDSCGLIFVEDNLWLEGTVSGKTTIVAGNIIDTNVEPNVYLIDDITYAEDDGSDGLTVVGEGSVLVVYQVPYDMELSGAFIAQTGSFGRNHYTGSYGKRGTLTMNGSIVSNGRVGTQWTVSSCIWILWWKICTSDWSGFANRINHYDRQLADDPPPFTPYMDDEYRFVEWRQEE
jgi:hypothetical protein